MTVPLPFPVSQPQPDLTRAHITRHTLPPMHDWHVRYTQYLRQIAAGKVTGCTAAELADSKMLGWAAAAPANVWGVARSASAAGGA